VNIVPQLLSIRIKLVGATFLIGLIALSVGLSFRLRYTRTLLAKNFISKTHTVIWAFSGALSDHCINSPHRLRNLAKMIMAEPDVDYVAFFDKNKEIITQAGNFQNNLGLPASDDPKIVLTDRHRRIYNVSRPIYDDTRKVAGYIAAGFPTMSYHKALEDDKRNIVVTWGLALLTVLIASYFILGRIIRPLEKVKTAMMKIGDGDLTEIIPVSSRDEIGVIARECNAMAMKLAQTYHNLSDVNQKLTEINERKSEFLSTAAHDLRTPLTLIGGFAETLSNKNLNLSGAQKDKYLDIIASETKKMAKFISDYLDITKIENGMHLPVMAKINPEAVAREAAAEFDFESAKVIFAIRSEPAVAKVTADGEMLERVLRNLIDNALKYAPQNTAVTLEITRRGRDTVFSVSDSGMGIPDDLKEKIFEKFFSANRVNAPKKQGTGLGLAIVRSIVQLHGGTIHVEDNPPRGSRFVFTIPDIK
jgi:signal transduction histidine kinase